MALAIVLGLGACSPRVAVDPPAPTAVGAPPARAEFGGDAVSADARAVATWAVATSDHGALPFAVVDKRAARLHVFGADGRIVGSAPILVGSAIGDHTVPGVGDKPIAEVRPEERTTPAGRFVTAAGLNAKGKPVIWVDYDAAVSMHAVIDDVKAERRLERIASPDPARHRISYGCINVPVDFFAGVALPALQPRRGAIVYVLPEVRPLAAVFPALAAETAVAVRPAPGG